MKKELAKQYFLQGYNCSQSVVMAFSEDLDIDKDSLIKIALSFGGGMGRLREVCGAVTGMFIIAGLKNGTVDADIEKKKEHYELIQNLANKFKKENGDIICRNLLNMSAGQDTEPKNSVRTAEFYKKRPCVELVQSAVEILEKVLFDEK